MLNSLTLTGFTVFKQAEVSLCQGINLVIGENGFGKSHLLKLGYCAAWYCDAMAGRGAPSDRAYREHLLGEKLLHVFRPDQLGRLARRGQGRSRAVVDVRFGFDRTQRNFKFSFASHSKTDVSLDMDLKSAGLMPAVFLPTKEVVSMYPGFTALYRDYHLVPLCLKIRALSRSLQAFCEDRHDSESGRSI